MTVDGIDVASYQNTAYATAGLGFVIVKATEGTAYINTKHSAQVATGRAHELVVGHYHFVRPGGMDAQVAYFLAHANPKPGDILALDWEDANVSSADKDAWIKHAQAAAPGHRVLLYCNRDFWLKRDKSGFCGDGLWIADPDGAKGKPRVTTQWTIHQYSEAGGTDRNTANFESKATLQTWALKGATPVAHKRQFEPFPGEGWFHNGRTSPLVGRTRARLEAEGCGKYRSNTNKDTWGSGDTASWRAWQRKNHLDPNGIPGVTSWNLLRVPD